MNTLYSVLVIAREALVCVLLVTAIVWVGKAVKKE